jgi:hypothetical protein
MEKVYLPALQFMKDCDELNCSETSQRIISIQIMLKRLTMQYLFIDALWAKEYRDSLQTTTSATFRKANSYSGELRVNERATIRSTKVTELKGGLRTMKNAMNNAAEALNSKQSRFCALIDTVNQRIWNQYDELNLPNDNTFSQSEMSTSYSNCTMSNLKESLTDLERKEKVVLKDLLNILEKKTALKSAMETITENNEISLIVPADEHVKSVGISLTSCPIKENIPNHNYDQIEIYASCVNMPAISPELQAVFAVAHAGKSTDEAMHMYTGLSRSSSNKKNVKWGVKLSSQNSF